MHSTLTNFPKIECPVTSSIRHATLFCIIPVFHSSIDRPSSKVNSQVEPINLMCRSSEKERVRFEVQKLSTSSWMEWVAECFNSIFSLEIKESIKESNIPPEPEAKLIDWIVTDELDKRTDNICIQVWHHLKKYGCKMPKPWAISYTTSWSMNVLRFKWHFSMPHA